MKNCARFLVSVALILAPCSIANSGSTGRGIEAPRLLSSVVFQDFETPSGWNGANPPANWSIIDNGASDGTWDTFDWYRYPAWEGGTARVSGGSLYRYNNDWIISPSADFDSAVACTLFYRHYYDDYLTQAADSALVLLSRDGGVTWGDTVATYAGADFGSDTVPDSEYFDISGFVSGYSAVKVAFQYVKRQAVLVGSWRIDDVRFRADGSAILAENFDSSWGPYGNNPPANWVISDVNVIKWDDNDWHQANLSSWGNTAAVFWFPVEQQDEMLISPTMDFSDSTFDIILSFKQWYNDQPNSRDTAFILGSIDDGVTWAETLGTYQGADSGTFSAPAYENLNMLAWANNQANVRIGFKYVGNNDGNWYIDSVNVERVDVLANDVSAVSIVSPPATTIEGYNWPVSAVVENVGAHPNSFNTIFIINDSSGAMVYSDTQYVNNLASLDQRIINFDTWHAIEANTDSMTCFTKLANDMDRSNDTVSASTTTYAHVGSAGPVEGWAFRDNITGGGPNFAWVDIRSYGSPISFSDDDDGNSGMIDMGMAFDYFGATYSRISVSTDGWLSFVDSTSVDNSNSAIPDADGPAAMVALLWVDLHLRTGAVYYSHNPLENTFIVQYDSVEYKSSSGSDIGMEIIFDEDDNSIKMQYQYFAGGSEPNVTIGLENQMEDAGLPYNNNGEIGQTPLPGLAITYTFLPSHDIEALAVDQPRVMLHDGQTYDIVARFRNAGANTESFTVTASDNFGYSNSQAVENLASLATTTVTFPDWSIAEGCSTYVLTVFNDLSGDLNRANDTLAVDFVASSGSNVEYYYDTEWYLAEYFEPDTLLANQFSVDYSGAILSAIAYKFTNRDDYPDWPDSRRDSVDVYLFLDEDFDRIPDDVPVYSSRILTTDRGWTIWNVACETTITLSCQNFWAAWGNPGRDGFEGIILDMRPDYPEMKWWRVDGEWQVYPSIYGDYLIRAYVTADSTTAPDILLGDTLIASASPPDGADTATTFIQNTGTGCDLRYRVTVQQGMTRGDILNQPESQPPGEPATIEMLRNMHSRLRNSKYDEITSLNPPQILGSGGPDDYGYTWMDSDDPEGPVFVWVEIAGIGTEVTWEHGTAEDGYTDPIFMGMTFNFYGANYDSIVISTNGWVSFLPAIDPFPQNTHLPFVDELNALLAVDWDDLDGGTAGHCYYYHDMAANAFLISWVNWSHYPAPTNPHDFQVIVDGTSGTITYQYGSGSFQSDVTVGIEDDGGRVGLQVAYNQSYIHNNLAVLFKPPIFWLSTDLGNGTLPPSSSQLPFNIFMNASGLPAGTYDGAILIRSNDVDEPVSAVNVHFEIEGVCAYMPGDVNGTGEANGVDVVFMVNYFKGLGDAPREECPPCENIGDNMLYPQGDVNGSCAWNGVDVTYFVNYLKGIGPSLRFCDQCPPAQRARFSIENGKPALNDKRGATTPPGESGR